MEKQKRSEKFIQFLIKYVCAILSPLLLLFAFLVDKDD